MLKASQNKNVLSWRLKAAWDGILRSQDMKFIDVFFVHFHAYILFCFSPVQRSAETDVG